MSDLTCKFLGLKLRNPIILASGILGTSADLLERAARAGAGAVTSKSCGPRPRAGHPNPVAVDWGHGLINAIGLSNPGAKEEASLLAETREQLEPLGVPLIASIFAGTVAEFGDVARTIAAANPDLIEVTEDPIVSSDVIGNTHSVVFDAKATMRAQTRMLKTLSWYDNSQAQASRIIDLVKAYGKVGVEGGAA